MDDSNMGSKGSSESVEEWLEQIAEAEGLSREETLEDLVTSYWKLEEIFHLLQDTGIDLDPSRGIEADEPAASQSDLEEVRSRLDGLSDELQAAPDSYTKAEVSGAFSELAGRIDTFEDQLSDISRELNTLLEEPVDEHQDTEDRLITLEKRMNRLEANVSGVDERVESMTETMVPAERFEAFARESESLHESLNREQQSLKERVRFEFGNIRTVLAHLLESAGRDEVGDRREFEGGLREHLGERAVLASLVHQANREGIRTATCQRCRHQIDLALLEVAACPNCEQPVERIKTENQYWGLSQRYVLAGTE